MTTDRTIKCHTPQEPSRYTPDTPPDLEIGEEVFWVSGSYHYPCTVREIEGRRVTVETNGTSLVVFRKELWKKM